jgi:hypothetical protein
MSEHEDECLKLVEWRIARMSYEEKEQELANLMYCELLLNGDYFNEMIEEKNS